MRSTSRQIVTGDEEPAVQRHAMFIRVILPCRQDLTHSARRLCGSDEDRVQDLVQDTFVRAYRACLAGRFQLNTNPRAWLLRIVTNLYINEYNHRLRWESRTDLSSTTAKRAMGEASRRVALTGAPAALLLAPLFDEKMEQALQRLPNSHRLCLLLVDVEGLDYEAAAQHLEVPIGTVRSRLSRARSRMRVLLQDDKTHDCWDSKS